MDLTFTERNLVENKMLKFWFRATKPGRGLCEVCASVRPDA